LDLGGFAEVHVSDALKQFLGPGESVIFDCT
jgi:hypothetical protein